MITVHENGKTYKVQMRASFAKTIRSEKAFRAMVERSIANYEANPDPRWQAYGRGLRNKGLWDICSILGCITSKTVVTK